MMRESTKVVLPDEYLIEIGRVSAQWSMLESILDLCLMKLLGKEISDPRSWIVFAHMTFPLKLDVLGALVESCKGDHPKLADYPQVRNQLKEAQSARNIVVHCKWGTNPETGQVEVSRITAREKLKTEVRPIAIGEIRETVELIGKAAADLYRLVVSSAHYPSGRL